MPKYSLEIRCQLENVGSFGPTDLQQFEWHIKFRCSGCNEERDIFRAVVIEKRYSQSGTRGEFHHVETCKFCGSSSTAEILEKEVPFAYGEVDSGSFKPVCSFDCRGLEPMNFDFGTGYTVSAAHSSQKFRDVDLTEKEWTDYDDEAKEPVGIMELESRFVRRK